MRHRFNGARRLSLGEWRQQQQNEDYEQINSNSGWNRFSVLRSTQLHSVSLDLPQEMTFPAMVDISLFCSFSPHLAKKTNKIGNASNILCTIKFTWVQFDDNVIAGCIRPHLLSGLFNIWSVCIAYHVCFFKCCQVIQHLGWLLVGAWTLVSFFLLLFCGFFSPLFLVSVFIVFAAKLMFYLTSNDGLKEKDKRQFRRLQYHWPDSLNPELYKRKQYDLAVVIVGLVTVKDYIFG